MDFSDLFDDDDSSSQSRSKAAAEKHLRSPILASLLARIQKLLLAVMDAKGKESMSDKKRFIPVQFEHILSKICRYSVEHSYSGLQRLVEPLIRDLPLVSSPPLIKYPDTYPELFHRTLGLKSDLDESWKHANELYEDELQAFGSWAKLPEFQQFVSKEKTRSTHLSKQAYHYYEAYRYWDSIVERYRYRKKNDNFGSDPLILGDSRFFFYDGFLMEQIGIQTCEKKDGKIVRRIPPKRYLYSYEQLQMIQDTCLARFNAFLAISNEMHNGSRDTEILVTRILQWQEDVLTKYGNKGYELVKAPEAIAKAYLTKITGGDVLKTGSFERTADKIRDKERKFSKEHLTPLTDTLLSIINDTKDLWTCAEIFGCTKLSGHPFVYAEISAESVQSEGCPQAKYDILAINDYHNHFKHLVLTRYLSKHKVWPPFSKNMQPTEGTKLHYFWKNEVTHLAEKSYPLTDWRDVEFGKFMEFDYSPDYLDMIDDKAICPGASKAAGFWFQSDTTSYRRLLESLIKTRDVDTYAIVERMRRGLFSMEERIIELTQKEREFKTSARCFCKLVFEVRLFFVLTEANLKRFMGGDAGDNGYMPQQTMTMSNSKLKKRLYDLTSNKKRDNTCLVEVDFTRWNLRWRAASVNPISRSLERIFGLQGVFSQAHNFFSSSTVVLTDKHTLPPGVKKNMPAHLWPNSKLVWRNHVGGFEGIQQTLWTICTTAMMYYSLRDENCSFQMAGQGDNQVFYISFDLKNNTLQRALTTLLKNMEYNCQRLNHEVKPEECVDSTTVLTYGKEIYAEGVHILYSLKFSSRAFARLDNTVPSLQKEVAGIVANSVAVAGTLKNTFRANWWKYIQVLLLLRRRLHSSVYASEHSGLKRLLKSRESRRSLLIPGSLGGLPMMPWTRFFSKGETDDLSFDVAATYYLSKNVPLIRNYMALLLCGEFTPREVDQRNLINDPHSIPIERPNDASHLISDSISKTLPNIVVNKDIKQLVDPSLRGSGESYKDLLLKFDPLYPEIIADLFDLTPAGLYQKTIKRFSMTRTIEKICPGTDFSRQIEQANCLFLKVFLNRLVQSSKTIGLMHPTPFEAASQLRELWKLNLQNSSIGIYTPFEFELGHYNSRRPTISARIRTNTNLLNTHGLSPPNFGTKTMQKTTDHGYKIVNCNSTMRDLKNTILMYSELQGDTTIRPYIDSIIQSRSPWNTDQLTPLFPSVYGGTAVHRHASSRHKFAMLGSCSVPTHIILSSDEAGILSGGEEDYPVVFQTLYLTLSNCFQLLASTNLSLPTSLSYYIPDSLVPINNTPVTVPKNLKLPTWPELTGNRLAWVEEMFASEVPLIPDKDLVPHIKTIGNETDMIYSYIETEISPNLSTMKVWDGILQPKDIFDFKEISRINPYQIEDALIWACITESFNNFLSYDTTKCTVKLLKEITNRTTMILSGMWVRVRLHPSFSNSDYNQKRNLVLQPGEIGYKRPVEFICSVFKKKMKNVLENKTTLEIPRLILFSDWKENTKYLARRRLVLSHISVLYPNIDVETLKDAITKSSPPSTLLERDPASYLHASTRRISRKIQSFDYVLPSLECQYINMKASEAMRLFRERDVIRMPKSITTHEPKYSSHGIIRYTINTMSGTLQPDWNLYTIQDEDRMRILKRRTIGMHSPLYSDWNAVLCHLFRTNQVDAKEVHLLGVGRGATARAFSILNMECIGYDLLDTFPSIAQRSSSYKPPEIMAGGNPNIFHWSNHTFIKDGDVLHDDLDVITSNHALSVIDLDIPVNILIQVLKRLPLKRPVICRAYGSPEQLRYLISVLHPKKIYCLCLSSSTNEPTDIICYIDQLEAIGEGNYESVVITKLDEISYTYEDTELIHQMWSVYPELAKYLELQLTDSIEELRHALFDIKKYGWKSSAPVERECYKVLNQLHSEELPLGRYLRYRSLLENILK
ncbi:RNA dependent RNA polymerase [Plasmopara viticola lesion associated mononega virus 2]|uniref:RNA-directed RNA polymerase n=1 Tax=Plasmopara viticola lesion associated mononega virus 2 TaxID=2692009 RepID=A0A6B9Q748_9MONO|nr:RNA dependent RNA polymerase [Plasmopara viticola lesion associated mononega virus 2]QHD64785.1 RNA dependent RNA polymerase [Plasmopara viticola lesion associated mononega virus 2]